MEAGNKTICDERFRGNILVVCKTWCRKMYFSQKLALNNVFGNLVKTEWVSGIELYNQREVEISLASVMKLNLMKQKNQMSYQI